MRPYLDSGIAAGNPCVFLQGHQGLLSHLQIVWVVGRFVQKVGGLDEFRAQQILPPVNLKVRREGLWNKVVALHHLVEDLVALDGGLYVAHENL